MKILIAEDDPNILNGLAEICESQGYETITAADGTKALKLYQSEKPDFVCLDIMMPQMSGYDVCRQIRKSDPDIPVIFISAKSEEVDKVLGLELGGDDYITKPFGLREVIARIRAVTRRVLASRNSESGSSYFTMGELEVFPDQLRAKKDEEIIDLSLRDVKILQILHEQSGKVVDRDTFFHRAWDLHHIPNSRTLDQHISQLRKKIETDPKNPLLIQTVHGIGYRYDP